MSTFFSSGATTLYLLMEKLAMYEGESGWKVNKEKSSIYIYESVPMDMVITMEILTILEGKYFLFCFSWLC